MISLKDKRFFVRLLKKHKKYNRFYYRFKSFASRGFYFYRNRSIKDLFDIEYDKNIHYPYEIIRFAFNWSETKEGHDYWSRLHTKFERYQKQYDSLDDKHKK